MQSAPLPSLLPIRPELALGTQTSERHPSRWTQTSRPLPVQHGEEVERHVDEQGTGRGRVITESELCKDKGG